MVKSDSDFIKLFSRSFWSYIIPLWVLSDIKNFFFGAPPRRFDSNAVEPFIFASYLPGRIAAGGWTFLTDFIWMASISGSIGATEVLVPYFCQARDGGYEYGSYSQFRAHLAISQPIWRKGWHRPKLGIISYVISAFLPLFCQKVAKIDPSGRIRAIFSYKKAF